MKKKFIQYYSLIILILFILFNIILDNLKFDGILFIFSMIIICVFNILFIMKNAKQIKFKGIILLIFFLIMLSANSIYHLLFVFTTILFLAINCFNENKFNKIITIIIAIWGIAILPSLSLGLLFVYGSGKQTGLDDIYDDTHYCCNNNYEVYSYSSGALDCFHYSIGKHYEILNIDDIIYISYNERNEVSREEYDNYLNNHKCKLVGDKNGSK